MMSLTNVKWIPLGSANEVTEAGIRYLTVQGYTNLQSTEFARGKIYRLGGTSVFEFGPDDIHITYKPELVNLNVAVTIVPWTVVTPSTSWM
jgi:hypothetical protein